MTEININDRVRHELMGEGVVTNLFLNSKASVLFDNGIEAMCKISSLTLIKPKPTTFTVTKEISVSVEDYQKHVREVGSGHTSYPFTSCSLAKGFTGVEVDAAYREQVNP